MKVFISWSGQRSRSLAVSIHEWLPNVLQAVEPWISSEDIEKGSRWASEISTRLSQIDFGVICMTPENQHAPWLLFEAGALSKSIATSAVATVLLSVQPTEVTGPLSQFQHTQASHDDIKKLVDAINNRLAAPLSQQKLNHTFELWWPQLESRIAAAAALEEVTIAHRTERDLLEELLVQSRTQSPRLLRESRFVDWLEDFARALSSEPGEATLYFVSSSAGARRAEKGITGTLCPFHKRYMTIETRESVEQGQIALTATGCCNFATRLAYENIKDLGL